jgi:hypothetical protein
MRTKLLPIPFFIGIAMGFASLSCLGAFVQSKHLIDDFVRFHQLITVEAGYFVTARQIKAIVDKTSSTDRLVYVIVGGSSVLNGVGQQESLVWTRLLQERLGARFRVVNFAQRAGRANEFGNIAAEYLLRSSKRVIFVADAPDASYASALVTSRYLHAIFDAWRRDFLLPWPPRDNLFAQAPFKGPDQVRKPALAAMLDTYLNFNDLWNFIVYDYTGLNWNSLLGKRSFEARWRAKDPELYPEQLMRYHYEHQLMMTQVRSQIIAPGDPIWQNSIDLIEQTVPPQLRAISLGLIDLASPYYVRELTAAEQMKYSQAARHHAQILTRLGFKRVLIPSEGFSEDDYIDRIHLSVSGGQKLAAAVAPTVQEIAVDLGYLK